MVIYFDILDFSKVLDGLRKEYRFEEINPEVLSGEKVGFILKFQENNQRFKLLDNELFISSSYYLKNKGKVPDVEEFIKFEREFKEYIRKVFNSENIIGFNHKIEAIRKYYGVELSNCYFKLLRNGEQNEVKLNSFYLRDLR